MKVHVSSPSCLRLLCLSLASYFKLFISFSGSEVERSLTPAVVCHPRRAVTKTELELSQGDIVFLHRRLNRDWYLGEKRGVIGLIPASYIQ